MLSDGLPDKLGGDDDVRAFGRVAGGGRCCDFLVFDRKIGESLTR